jgi:hypothetical protein
MTAPKRKAAPGTRPRTALQSTARVHDTALRSRVGRLQLTARCLELTPIFVADVPVAAELFDKRGRHVETWCWS